MALTREWKQKKTLLRSGYFKDEVKAWSHWDWKETPWLNQLRVERSKLVTRWCKETGHKRSEISPIDLRQSFTYRVMVKQWYRDHGWITSRGDRDAFALLRAFKDPWDKTPEGKKKQSPWKQRQISTRKRRQAIDDTFSRSKGLQVI